MKRMQWRQTFGILALLCGCGGDPPDKLISTGFDANEMEEAITRARGRIDVFVAQMEKGDGTDFSVKVKITDGKENEHFWLSDLSFRDGVFEGSISNEPGIVRNVKRWQRWNVAKSDISDWMYRKNGKIRGNYTLRPLLKAMPPAEAAKYRELLAEP